MHRETRTKVQDHTETVPKNENPMQRNSKAKMQKMPGQKINIERSASATKA